MASYELNAFDRRFQSISLVGAIEQQGLYGLNVGYWLRDPNQFMQWPKLLQGNPRQDFLWQHTCYEIFIGVHGEDYYRKLTSPPLKLGKFTSLRSTVILRICHHKLPMTLSLINLNARITV